MLCLRSLVGLQLRAGACAGPAYLLTNLYLFENTIRIVVYSPQIIENYKLKSGEALSILFIIIWLLGDLCSLVGASMAGLLPTIIILAVYVSHSITGAQLLLTFHAIVYRMRSHTFIPNILLSM